MDRVKAFFAATEGVGDRVKDFMEHQPFGASTKDADEYRAYKRSLRFTKEKPMTFSDWKAQRRRADTAKKSGPPQYGPEYIKKTYGITIIPLSEPPKDEKEMIFKIKADLMQWLGFIKSSDVYRQNILEIANAWKNGDPGEGHKYHGLFSDPKFKATPVNLSKMIHAAEGVNGWAESAEIIDGDQEFCVEMGWVCSDLADMLRLRYGKMLGGISSGDGDEGHVYYQINL